MKTALLIKGLKLEIKESRKLIASELTEKDLKKMRAALKVFSCENSTRSACSLRKKEGK